MEYSFINDPVLRTKLEKASKKNLVKTEINNENKLSKNESVSTEKSIKKRRSKPNKKFESLKSKEKKIKEKDLNPPLLKHWQ